MSSREAIVALTRFGLGPRPGEAEQIARDPRAHVLAALASKDAALVKDPALEPGHVVYARANQAQIERQVAEAFGAEGAKTLKGKDAPGKAAPRAEGPRMEGMAEGGDIAGMAPGQTAPKKTGPTPGVDKPAQIRQEALRAEMTARLAHAHSTEAAFLERLVMYWSNHFCVNANKGAVRGLAGAFEREAIRPHVLGRFADMLAAVEQHPAMLIYLDNQASTGPNSQVGRNRNRGLNENLAREILELHTLGVDGGYTQADVTNLARVITGWTVGQPNQPNAELGKFFFAPARHEPGQHPVLGRRYGGAGVKAGEQCLADLARHPSTARHIARKLAAHFVGSAAPPALVARLEAAFRDSNGDLAKVAHALATSDEAWTAPARTLIPPYDYIVALARTFGLDQVPPLERVRLMAALGQPLWRPPSPKGWPDTDDAWASPSALRERLRIAERAALQIAARGQDPRELAQQMYGAALGSHTREAVARAEAREQAVALLIMSPDFQRR
jgi:uncharacterized protein (DUF1800 family)